MWLRPLLAAAFVSTLGACASSPAPSKAPETPANLRQSCKPLTKPNDGTRASVLKWAKDTVLAYRECADRVEKLNGR